jgi:hypothetical protein
MQEVADLLLDRPLEHELGTQPAELGEPFQAVDHLEPAEQRLLDRSFHPDARGYPSFHGVVLLMRTSRSASEPMPCSLFQRSLDVTTADVLAHDCRGCASPTHHRMVHTREILRGLGQPGSAIVIARFNPTERPRREITRRTLLVRDLRRPGEAALLVGTVIADRRLGTMACVGSPGVDSRARCRH